MFNEHFGEEKCALYARTKDKTLIKEREVALICSQGRILFKWISRWIAWALYSASRLGPPGPPDKVSVEEITDSTAQLSWTPGRDNGSPITGYSVQARTPFTVGWQAVDTGDNTHYACHRYKI